MVACGWGGKTDYKEHEEPFGSGEYAHHLHCTNGLIGTYICQLHQVVYCKMYSLLLNAVLKD